MFHLTRNVRWSFEKMRMCSDSFFDGVFSDGSEIIYGHHPSLISSLTVIATHFSISWVVFQLNACTEVQRGKVSLCLTTSSFLHLLSQNHLVLHFWSAVSYCPVSVAVKDFLEVMATCHNSFFSHLEKMQLNRDKTLVVWLQSKHTIFTCITATNLFADLLKTFLSPLKKGKPQCLCQVKQ